MLCGAKLHITILPLCFFNRTGRVFMFIAVYIFRLAHRANA